MNTTNSNTQQQNFVLKPSQSLIDNWKLWMAQETVNQLKTRPTGEINVSKLLPQVKLSELDLCVDKIWDVFLINFNRFKQRSNPNNNFHNFQEIKNILDKEFSQSITKHFQKTLASLERSHCDHLQEAITDNLQKVSPQTAMNLLKDSSKLLFSQRRKFENDKYEAIEKIFSITQAFQNLVISNDSNEQDHIWNALRLLYKCKIDKERYLILSNLILKLLQIIQSHYDSAQRTFLLLTNVEKSLAKKCHAELVSVPVFIYFKVLDINHQQLLINSWIGHSINYWGNSPIKVEEFEEKILDNIDNISKSLFYDFQLSFLENTIIENVN